MASSSGRSEIPSRLLLLCAETPAQRRQLLVSVSQRLQRRGRAASLVDLDGQALVSDAVPAAGRFCASTYGAHLWQQLHPSLVPWLQLLELDPAGSLSPWHIPGLVDVLRMLFLAEAWESAEQQDQALVVVMPPLAQTLEIVRLAARGPQLLESLWSPLLHWWGDTRQRLGQFELVLRLRLPSADGLMLPPLWQRRLQALSQQLAPDAGSEMLWAMALEAEDVGLLQPRVAAVTLAGRARQRLWIEASTAWVLPAELESQLAVPLLIGQSYPSEDAWTGWQQQPFASDVVQWSECDGERQCSLLLPGVVADGLQVLTGDRRLVLQNTDHRLELPFPEGWPELECRSAKLISPRLTIAFEASGS